MTPLSGLPAFGDVAEERIDLIRPRFTRMKLRHSIHPQPALLVQLGIKDRL